MLQEVVLCTHLEAGSGPRVEEVPTAIEDQDPGFDKTRHLVPIALLVGVQRFRKALAKHKIYLPLDMFTGSYCRHRRGKYFRIRRDEIHWDLISLSLMFRSA